MKLGVHDLARQPHVESVEHATERQSGFAEKFSLGELEESDICAITNDPGEVDISPTHKF